MLEKETATHSSILAWKIPQTEKPGGCWTKPPPRPKYTVNPVSDIWLSNPEAVEMRFIGTVRLELGYKGRAGLRKVKRKGDDFPSLSNSSFELME